MEYKARQGKQTNTWKRGWKGVLNDLRFSFGSALASGAALCNRFA
jgi:hypothetical protein